MTKSIPEQFQEIIHHLIGSPANRKPLAGIDIAEQFHPENNTSSAIARNSNAAFLIALAGKSHSCYGRASEYLSAAKDNPASRMIASFYRQGLALIPAEVAEACATSKNLTRDIENLHQWLQSTVARPGCMETIEQIRSVFFPEGVGICTKRDTMAHDLRKKRTVTITRLNPTPIRDPFKEILFSSNILLTVPTSLQDIDEMALSRSLRDTLRLIIQEDQVYWYDHPIQVGAHAERNEVIYGLRGLEHAISFEKQRGTCDKEQSLTCVLSVSVTHNGLHAIAQQYLEEALRHVKGLDSIKVHLFTESETDRLLDEVLLPASHEYLQGADTGVLHDIIGVDGEYGRHYTFLKAVAAFWQVLINPTIRGTFKIDLDQVFPQKELVEQSGSSAFEHFTTPLWGAEGLDSGGRPVELGMLAGALVNEKDIGSSLFTPDVCFPPQEIRGDELIFLSTLPQALSTESEMMTRYTDESLDGKTSCIQRIHVTGGTCGILVDSLRTYRPFTPTFIGRAEDQAYLLSVLLRDQKKNLRYVHKDGFIMRHDKEAFAGEAIKKAYIGKLVGDYARILWFSAYARALPWPTDLIKDQVDPFTGCFISRIPLTIVYLRLALKAATYFATADNEAQRKGRELLSIGIRRLSPIIQHLSHVPNPLVEQYQREKRAWDLYYDILSHLEAALERGDPRAVNLREKARKLVEETRLRV